MRKQIRPLTAYKKAYPELYEIITGWVRATSSKGRENETYFYYATFMLSALEPEGIIPTSFFYKPGPEKTNIGTVTELGRLLLSGWYYNIEDWTKKVALYVYQAYKRTEEKGEVFNDLDFKRVVEHLRENIGYYYNREPELKLYILEKLFNDELQPLLPKPPVELKKHKRIAEYLDNIHKRRLKQSKDWYKENYNILESYSSYLTGILEELNITGYLSLEEFIEERDRKGEEYREKIEKISEDYRGKLLDIAEKGNLLPENLEANLHKTNITELKQ